MESMVEFIYQIVTILGWTLLGLFSAGVILLGIVASIAYRHHQRSKHWHWMQKRIDEVL
jgi:hypothetical protein